MGKKYYIGEIVNTQGIKGELRILLYEGYRKNFKDFKFFYIEEKKYLIEKFRFKKNLLILKLEGIDDINEAELFIKKKIYLYRNEIPINSNEFLIDDIIGFDVFYSGEKIGIVKDIDLLATSQGLIVVKTDNDLIMVPLHMNFIEKRDMENSILILKNIEGLV